jgi:hypothetical protein
MTGSRVKALLAAAALGTLLLPASAQWTDSKPPVLEPEDYPPLETEDPPDPPKTAPAPHQATGAPQTLGSPAEVQTLPAPGQMAPPAAPVEVGALGTPEGPPVGMLDAANDGFSDRLWAGSDRANAEDLLAKAPLVSGDPVLRELVRRVVLTKAPSPPGQAKKPFVMARIERLLDAGQAREAGALAAAATVSNDAAFARLQADAVLIANRAQDVCGPVTAARLSEGDKFWLQLRAYCADAAGDSATAELTRQVLKAQGAGDPAYDALIAAIAAKKPPAALTIANPTALHVFLYQQAAQPLPEAVARKMGAAESVIVLRDSRHPAKVRFEAAERVAATGTVPFGELVKLADAQDLPLGKVANAAADAPNLPLLAGQTLLRRAGMIERRPEQQAQLVTQALTLGEAMKQAPLAAAMQADVIATLKPGPELQPYARRFARALVLAHRAAAAGAWTAGDPVMKTVVAMATNDPARLAAAQKDFSAFAAALQKNPPDADPDRAYKALVLGLADVTGTALPPEAKAAAANVESGQWDGARPGPGQMRTIVEISATPERRGEAILLLTGAIQTIGLKDMAPDVTIEFVRLLMDMNVPGAARALAVEALVQYVPPSAAPAK